MDIFLFGDQTASQEPLLRKLASRKDSGVLVTFLERAAGVLKNEIRKLPHQRRQAIPTFLTIANLIDVYYADGVKIPELESALVTLSQLGHYLGYYDESSLPYPSAGKSRAVALCTGLLAAAAISSARSLTDLVPLALESVKLSFRIGTLVGKARDVLGCEDAALSWSTIVTNVSEDQAQAALSAYHLAANTASSSVAYLSALSTAAVTVSGPPSTTKRLFAESDVFSKCTRVPIPVFAPYHAKHLISAADVDTVFDEESQAFFEQFTPQFPLHSAATGQCQSATDTLELMRSAANEILREPVNWSKLLDETVNQVSAYDYPICDVMAVGNTNVTNSLVAALRAGGQQNIRITDHTAWKDRATGGTGRTQNDKIAIIGMAGRFPDAANHDELWDLLMKGLDVHREVPPDRFDAQAHYDPSGKGRNKSHTPYGCFIKEPGLFDPRFFNMSPREAAQTDPMGRLALVTAYEALEMSGYVPNRTAASKLHRVGTFYGQTSDDWREINAAENVDTYFITGGVRAFCPGRINYYFKFSGPSFSVDTACSSSLAAIQLACTSLWAGDLDTAIAGGLNVLTNPDIFSGLSKGQFLSKTGSCKTYDNDADGYCRGDGCGSIILKRYEDAIADKDNILGAILSAGTNHSAEAVSITHPHAGAQEFLYKKVLADAGVDAHDITYVEMHGTGTQAGDGIEMTSVTNAFAPRHRQRRADQPLYLGAVKANIGHGEAASGINSIAKILLMLRENKIPPNVGIKGIMNKSFPADLGQRRVHIPQTAVDLPRTGPAKRKIFLNNFSAAGGNTAVLLEDGPLRIAPRAMDPRSYQVITVTARAISSLKNNIHNLVAYLDSHPDATLTSLSYTTTARRIQHNYRVAFTVNDVSVVKSALLAQLKDTYSPVPMTAQSVAFTFTGQGSQYAGVGQQLYDQLKSFRADIDSLDHIARIQGLPSFLPLLTGSDPSTLSPVIVQLGMSCIQVALANVWASWGVKPVAVVGHSLGEYAALHIAGVLSASDMVYLVGRRAQLLVDCCSEYSHGMLAVKAGEDEVSELLGDEMTEIACRNTSTETVLCGTLGEMEAAQATLDGKGCKSTMLKVPFAFHSAQIDSIMEPFKIIARSVTYRKPSIPYLSPLLQSVVSEEGVIDAEYLPRHARETVDFQSAVSAAYEGEVLNDKVSWLEIGAHPVTSNMIKSIMDSTTTTACSLRRGEDTWKTLANSICTLYSSGVHINFDEFHREFNDAQELLTLPTYSFDNKNYWLDYHHNWTLTKGQPPLAPVAALIEAAPLPVSKLSTTSCQQIVREALHANSGTVVVQSDLAEPKLHTAVTGHLVNDAPLCPSSLYADQALTIVDYLYKQLRPKQQGIGFNVCKMEVPKPLIAKVPPPKEGQHIQIEATADIEAGQANLKWRSVTPDGNLIQEHAHCVVKFENLDDWHESWSMARFMVQNQVDSLMGRLAAGTAHKVLRGVAYKLFKALVNYDDRYKGMEEVVLDGKDTEATASISFQTKESDGNYFCAPYWIDSLCHITGFICNGTDLVDSDQNVYISHGWGTMRFARQFSADKKYRSYVKMQPRPNNVLAGDVYIFEGEEIVGVVGGVKFQQIPRRVLDVMLPPLKKRAAQPAAISAAPPVLTARTTLSVDTAVAKSAKIEKRPIVQIRKPATKKPASTIVSRVMDIISAETDVDMAELVDDAAFDNLGVDSLLSLTISARFREELDIDVPGTLFTDHTTIGSLKKYFASSGESSPSLSSESSSDFDDYDDATPLEDDSLGSPLSTPPSVSDDDEKPLKLEPARSDLPAASDGDSSIPRLILAEEMGVAANDIPDKADLAEMGLDSLMSLTVLSRLREDLGQEFPSTFLITNPTLEDVENALGMRPKRKFEAAPKPTKRPQVGARSTTATLQKVNQKLKLSAKDLSSYPPATSVVLQGNAKTATEFLFLIPDGSGSATSYVGIPKLGSNVAVYGFNCPFMKKAEDFVIGVEGVAQLYLKELKRRKPQGPYSLGGWSAGGVMAYEVAYQLLAQGDVVDRLILIDSPSPDMASQPLPSRLHHFFAQIGLLGDGDYASVPAWLLKHFEYTIKALAAYVPQQMPAGKIPKTFAIWCREGVCGRPDDPRPPPAENEDSAPMKFLLDNRTDFGDNGWGMLLGDSIEYGIMDGNHFTMMQAQHAETLGDLIRQGLGLKV